MKELLRIFACILYELYKLATRRIRQFVVEAKEWFTYVNLLLGDEDERAEAEQLTRRIAARKSAMKKVTRK